MGEIADAMIQDAMDYLDEDWYEIEDDEGFHPTYKPIKKCKYCKTTNLIWHELWPHKWVLWDPIKGERHICPYTFKAGKRCLV